MLEILYPNAAVLKEGWFAWCISALTIILAAIPNCVSQWTIRHMLRGTVYTTVVLMAFYFIWFPIAASRREGFQPASIMTTFYNGINTAVDSEGNTIVQASDSYCWVVGVLFGAWVSASTCFEGMQCSHWLIISLCSQYRNSTDTMHPSTSQKRHSLLAPW